MKVSDQKSLASTVAEFLDATAQRHIAHVPPTAGLKEIISAFARAKHTRLVYVVDTNKNLCGAISLGNLAKHLFFHHFGKPIDNLHLISMAASETAADFIDRPVITAHIHETIEPVLVRMLAANIKEIPVINDQGQLVGDLTLVDILHLCATDLLQ